MNDKKPLLTVGYGEKLSLNLIEVNALDDLMQRIEREMGDLESHMNALFDNDLGISFSKFTHEKHFCNLDFRVSKKENLYNFLDAEYNSKGCILAILQSLDIKIDFKKDTTFNMDYIDVVGI